MASEDTPTRNKPSFSVAMGADRVVQFLMAGIMCMCLWYIRGISESVKENSRVIIGLTANSFTSEDGLEVWKEIAKVREETADSAALLMKQIALVQLEVATIPKEVPPQWFAERVNTLETKIEWVKEQLAEMEAELKARLARIEAELVEIQKRLEAG